MKRSALDDLEEMIEFGRRIAAFVHDLDLAGFLADLKTQMAVAKAIEVIGEAARRVPEPIRQRHPEIPWRDIIGMRNALAHCYAGADLEVLFATAQTSVPLLLAQLASVIAGLGPDD